MNGFALTGLALAVGGAIGILALETIGTAYASRPGDRDYLVAVGVAAPVKFISTPGAAEASARDNARARVMVCRSVLGLGALSVGYRCGGS